MLVAGEANAPPRTGPIMLPTCHIRGKRLNALGCRDLCGTSSATVVLRMPTFPLLAPERALATIAHFRLREKPKSKLENIAHVKASRIVGFRPYLSDARPQGMAVRHWLAEKTADVMPAHLATSVRGTLNDSIISGR
jgi:hypothetical protein